MASFVKQLESLNSILSSVGPDARPAMLESHVASLKAQMSRVTLSAAEVDTLIDAVGTVAFTPAQEDSLMKAISDAVLRSCTPAQTGSRKPLQNLVDLGPYLVASEVAALQQKTTLSCKTFQVFRCCQRIGLVMPSEQSFGRCLGILGLFGHEAELKDQQVFYSTLQVLKGHFKKGKKSQMEQCPDYVTEYTGNPTDLPESVFKLAYANEKPVEWTSQTVAVTGPLRKTSRGLTDRTDPVNPQQAVMQMATSFAALMAGFTVPPGAASSSGFLAPNPVVQGSQRKTLALEDGHVEDRYCNYIYHLICEVREFQVIHVLKLIFMHRLLWEWVSSVS